MIYKIHGKRGSREDEYSQLFHQIGLQTAGNRVVALGRREARESFLKVGGSPVCLNADGHCPAGRQKAMPGRREDAEGEMSPRR